MPNRRAHDHIGQLTQKIGIRIGADSATQVITNVRKLIDLHSDAITISDIDRLVTKVINDPKFRTLFVDDFRTAAESISCPRDPNSG